MGDNFEGARNQMQEQGQDIIERANFEDGRYQVQEQDNGEGRGADVDEDGAAAAEGGQVQEWSRADIQARLRRAADVIMAETWANRAQRTGQPRELFQAGTKKEVKRPGRGRKDQ